MQLETEAAAITVTTKQESPRVCDIIESSLELLTDGLGIGKSQPTTKASIVTAALLSHNLGALRCSYLLAQQGYYTHATSLLRTVYENWISIQYVTLFPLEARLWLQDGEETPRHGEMLTKLTWNDDQKKHARVLYTNLCKFAHSTSLLVLPSLDPASSSVFFGAQYKPLFFRSYAYFASMLTAFTLDEVAPKVDTGSQWHTKRAELMSVVSGFMEEENKAARQPTPSPVPQ